MDKSTGFVPQDKNVFNLTGPSTLAREINTDVSDVLNSFTNAKKICKSSKHIIMQYKICHRIISCKEYLFRTKISATDRCYNCNLRDTIEHYFVSCPLSNHLWSDIQTWYNNTMGHNITLSSKLIILGSHPKNPPLANVILHGKWYIYKCKTSKTKIDLKGFKNEFRQQSNIEKLGTLLNKSKNAINKHNQLWAPLIQEAKISLVTS